VLHAQAPAKAGVAGFLKERERERERDKNKINNCAIQEVLYFTIPFFLAMS
jgi:hypothetical protein